MAATPANAAYLRSFYEYIFGSILGRVFVVSPDLANVLQPGDEVVLTLAQHGVSVVSG